MLVRRLSDDGAFNAAWYAGHATMRVSADGGADLTAASLEPEQGGAATKPLTVGGRFTCRGKIKVIPVG